MDEEIKLNALTSIDSVTSLVENIWVTEKTALRVSEQFDNSWLQRYPRPDRCIHDLGSEFIVFGFPGNTSTSRNNRCSHNIKELNCKYNMREDALDGCKHFASSRIYGSSTERESNKSTCGQYVSHGISCDNMCYFTSDMSLTWRFGALPCGRRGLDQDGRPRKIGTSITRSIYHCASVHE